VCAWRDKGGGPTGVRQQQRAESHCVCVCVCVCVLTLRNPLTLDFSRRPADGAQHEDPVTHPGIRVDSHGKRKNNSALFSGLNVFPPNAPRLES